MAEDVDLGFRESAAVDDAGVIQLVGDDVIFGRQNRRHGSGVRGESGLKHDAGLDVLERRDAPLQFHVQAHGAGDGPNRAGACAVASRGVDLGFDQLGMIRETQIVVRGEIDYFFAVESRDRFARGFEFAQMLKGSGFSSVRPVVRLNSRGLDSSLHCGKWGWG